MNSDWRYRETFRQCTSYVLEHYMIKSQVEELMQHMFSCGHITLNQWQYINETVHTEDKMKQLLSILMAPDFKGVEWAFDDFISKLSEDKNRLDIPSKLTDTLSSMKNRFDDSKKEDDILELLNKLQDNFMCVTPLEMLQSIKLIGSHYRRASGRRNKDPNRDDSTFLDGPQEDYSELMKACVRGDCAADITNLIQNHAELNWTNKNKQTALMIACKYKRVEIVQLFLDKSCDQTVKDIDGRTVLMYAMIGGDVEILQMLMCNQKCEFTATDYHGLSFIWYIFGEEVAKVLSSAVRVLNVKRDIENTLRTSLSQVKTLQKDINWRQVEQIVEFLLLQKGVDQKKLLEVMILLGKCSLVSMVLQKGNPSMRKNDITDYIVLSIQCDDPDIFKVLTGHEEIDLKNLSIHELESLVHSVIARGNHQICGMMLKLISGFGVNKAYELVMSLQTIESSALSTILENFHPAKFNMLDDDGNTVFMLICKYGGEELVSKLLDIPSIDFRARNSKDQSVLIVSLMNSSRRIAQILIDHPNMQLDVNDRSMFGVTNLMYACKTQNMDVVKILVSKPGIDINATDLFGTTALMYACSEDSSDIVSLLLRQSVIDVKKSDEDGMTALLYACWGNNIVAIQSLLQFPEIDVNAINKISKEGRHDMTALMYACQAKSVEAVKLLLSHPRININISCKHSTAFTYACEANNTEIISLLINDDRFDIQSKDFNTGPYPHDFKLDTFMTVCENSNADILSVFLNSPQININECINSDGERGLVVVIESPKCTPDAVSVLLESGKFDINAGIGRGGVTPLMIACKTGKPTIVSLLLNNDDIDINAIDDFGYSAFMYSCKSHNQVCLQLLIQTGKVKLDVMNRTNETTLMYACEGANVSTVKHIIETTGVDINAANKYGKTAFMFACEKGDLEMVELLVSLDVDINAKDSDHRTALMKTCARPSASSALVECLLKCSKLDVGVVSENGETALITACRNNVGTDVISQLVKRKDIGVNIVGKDGNTALMIACLRNNHAAVSSLIGHSEINLNAADKSGRTAWMLACTVKNTKALELLLECDIDLQIKDKSGQSGIMYAMKTGIPEIISAVQTIVKASKE